MRAVHLKLLQSMPIFGGIGEEALDFLLAKAAIVTVKRQEYFFHEGDPGTSMYVLERGKAVALRRWNDRWHAIKHFVQGDCFGEMAMIDLGRRTASVKALRECIAIELSNATLMQLYGKDLEQFAMIYMNIGRELSRRLRDTDMQLFRLKAELGR